MKGNNCGNDYKVMAWMQISKGISEELPSNGIHFGFKKKKLTFGVFGKKHTQQKTMPMPNLEQLQQTYNRLTMQVDCQ